MNSFFVGIWSVSMVSFNSPMLFITLSKLALCSALAWSPGLFVGRGAGTWESKYLRFHISCHVFVRHPKSFALRADLLSVMLDIIDLAFEKILVTLGWGGVA